jgi:polysaccharide biosynthesis transport protein
VELLDIFDILWRRKWIIVGTTILAAAIAVVGNFLITPMYSATAMLRVSASPNPLADRTDLQYAQRLMNTYALIADTQPVLSRVVTELNLPLSSGQVSDMIEITVIEETELIEIKASHSDPKIAADVANKLAGALISETNMLAGSDSGTQAMETQLNQVQGELNDMRTEYDRLVTDSPTETTRIAELSREIVIKQQTYETLLAQFDSIRLTEAFRSSGISLVEPAILPRNPTTPRKTLNIVLGGMLGLLGGVGLVLLLNNVDSKIYSLTQVKSLLDLPILAELGRFTQEQMKFSEMAPSEKEGYRRLRASVFTLQRDNHLKTLMITSPDNDEGKSTIVANLATSIAQLGRSVLVIDCDMRQPSQHSLLDLPNDIGLSTVLEKKVSLSEAIQPTSVPSLSVLTSGPVADDPPKLLASPFMSDMLRELAPKYDVILLDTPAAMPVVDTTVLAPLADGILLVVRFGHSQREALLATQDQINEVQAKIMGVVVNEAPVRTSPYYTAA